MVNSAHAGKDGVAVCQALQADGKLHIRGPHDVLHLEVLEARVVAQLCDDLAVLRHTPSCVDIWALTRRYALGTLLIT
jgi:hypothetical protein